MSAGMEAMLAACRKWVGYNEEPGNRTPFGKWYGLDGNPWCDMFLSYCANEAGQGKAVGRFAYTPSHANFFRRENRWGVVPRVGAIVFYEWPGMGRISHVGIVEAVSSDGQWITTIEGNTNTLGTSRTGGGVQRIRRNAYASYVRGFGYPDYTNDPETPAQTPVVRPAPVRPDPPKTNRFGRPLLVVDGGLGPKTIREWQHQMGTHPDGVISRPSNLVKAVQRRIGMTGRDVDGLGIKQGGPGYRTNTIGRLQRYLRLPVDKYLSTPESGTVKRIQERLNEGRF